MNKPCGVPERIDYRRYATREQAIEGTIPLVSLLRVTAVMHAQPGADDMLNLQLSFSEDTQRRVYASGRVMADLTLVCQRCAEPFVHSVDAVVAGVVVADDDAAAAVPRADEPIVADGDTLDVPALAEDELLLALPMVARCDRPDCRARYDNDEQTGDSRSPARDDNPFAVLEQLKRDHNTD